jgi:hypothetical protein
MIECCYCEYQSADPADFFKLFRHDGFGICWDCYEMYCGYAIFPEMP